MRSNIPTDSGFEALNAVEDGSDQKDKVTKEQIELAKIGNSPDWDIITKYIATRIDVYKNGLFGEDLSGKPTDVIGQRFLAAQSVIHEFQSLIDEVERTTKSVNEALK